MVQPSTLDKSEASYTSLRENWDLCLLERKYERSSNLAGDVAPAPVN
ncbi:hypothetical protein ES703_62031 [subsurface metagenome]